VSFNPPPLPPFQPQWGQFQVWWQQVIGDLQATINPLLDLNNDDLLTPSKKPIWIFIYSFLTGEQAGLDTEATTYGITTEKTNYDTAISTLTTYLATLTTPVPWNDLTGNTDIVGVTFRADFNDVMVKKQALLNKMHDAAKVTADAADAAAAITKRNDKISASATSPSNILTASDAGTDATITIASHTRLYGDATSLSVTGGSITGLAYSTIYGVYYDDTTTANTTPTYHATTTLKNAMANFAAGRHYCGQVTTPASGGGSTSGSGAQPPQGSGPYP
jgi:hypothetical protein